jgi:hypothetical protein
MTMKLTIRNEGPAPYVALVCRNQTTLARLEPGQETEQYTWQGGELTILELKTEATVDAAATPATPG